MANVVGLINLHTDISLKGLTERRPVASVSFLGRYGIIDFVLSNFSNSNITFSSLKFLYMIHSPYPQYI